MSPLPPSARVAAVKRDKPEYGESFEEWEARRKANEVAAAQTPQP